MVQFARIGSLDPGSCSPSGLGAGQSQLDGSGV